MIGWAECDSLMHTVVCMETIYQHALINLQHKRGSWRIAVNYLQPKGELVLSYVFICAHNRHIHILKAIVNSTTRNMHAVGNTTNLTPSYTIMLLATYSIVSWTTGFNYGSLASPLNAASSAHAWLWPSRNTRFFCSLYRMCQFGLWSYIYIMWNNEEYCYIYVHTKSEINKLTRHK